MFRYWLTHRAPISAGLAAVLMAVLMLGFVVPHIGAAAENRQKTGIYTDSAIDYDIPQPTAAQLEDIEALPFVDAVFGYYYTQTTVTVRDTTVPVRILFSAHMDTLTHTMYSPARLIRASTADFDNPVYIDEAFARQHDLQLGDCLWLRDIAFQVARIYETNSYYTSAIFMPLTGAQKELVENTADAYSGAFLMVNDAAAAEAWLAGYKPLGRLKDRALFATEAAYQLHYEQWAQSSYTNEITSFAARLQAASVRTAPPVGLGAAIVGLVMLCCSTLLFFAGQEKAYFAARKTKRGHLWFYGWTALAEAGLMALLAGAGLWYAVVCAGSYCPPAVIAETAMILAVMILCTAVAGLLLHALLLCTVKEDDVVCRDTDGGMCE
ncbi:MAG: hypothetical protein IJY28_10095 [Clostridia bacterium]|nr:hypothetical protein [Clostridia bacterium]